MGHQLLLCSSIPHNKYTQTVSTLQALTGLRKPQDIATYTIITKPHNIFKPKVEAGKVNQIEQYYMKCMTTWDDKASEDFKLSSPVMPGQSEIKVDRLFTGELVQQWTFHIADIPTAGKNAVLAQNFYESTMVYYHNKIAQALALAPALVPVANPILNVDETPVNGTSKVEDDDLMEIDNTDSKNGETNTVANEKNKTDSSEAKDSFLQFLEDLGYDLINQYWLKGIRFFHGDIVVEIFKIFIRDDNENAKSAEDPRIPLKLLDETNTFQIKAYINFPKGSNVDLISKGSKDLTNLKSTLQNLFELEVPDRMFMDSRVTRTT